MNIQRQRVKTESDLKTREKEHRLSLEIAVRWFTFATIVVIIFTIFIFTVVYLINNKDAQFEIVRQVTNNIGSLFVGAAVVLGIKFKK